MPTMRKNEVLQYTITYVSALELTGSVLNEDFSASKAKRHSYMMLCLVLHMQITIVLPLKVVILPQNGGLLYCFIKFLFLSHSYIEICYFQFFHMAIHEYTH